MAREGRDDIADQPVERCRWLRRKVEGVNEPLHCPEPDTESRDASGDAREPGTNVAIEIGRGEEGRQDGDVRRDPHSGHGHVVAADRSD